MKGKMTNMKAIVYDTYGTSEVLKEKRVKTPVPESNEVLIKVKATSVTSADVKLRQANPFLVRLYNGFLKPKNKILGTEFSGEIFSVGENVKKYKNGDEVFGFCGFGSYSEYISMPESGAFTLKPESLTHIEAAAIPFGALSALYFLKKANIRAGQRVMIYGASGSVGTYAIQLAKTFNAYVTAVCSTKNIPLITSIGADKAMDYTDEFLWEKLDKQDLIFDTVGKLSFKNYKDKILPGGKFASTSFDLELITEFFKSNLKGNKNIVLGVTNETKKDLDFLKGLIESGMIKPVIDRMYTIDQIKIAHEYVETGKKRGNLVITV